VLWLVSFGDEDDRELLPSQIATALRQGQIDGATIVWRDGLADWLPIASVPALAALIPTTGETTTAPIAIANFAPEPKAAPTEDVTTAPGLGNDDAAEAAPRTGAPGEPVAKIALKASQQPKGVVAEEVATVKAEDAPTDASGKPAWRGKTKIGLPKVDVQRPEIARRLEPVKAPAAKVETTAKPSATATPRPVATTTAKPPVTSTAKPPVTAAVKAPEPAAAPHVQAPPATPAEDVEPETARPVPAAVQPAKVEPPKAPVPEHSPEAPTAKLPEVTRTDARKPPVPERRPPPARSTIAGVGVTIGNVGAAKPAPKPPARAPQAAAPKPEAGNRGARDIWNNTDDEEPISVDPSSIRPPTPSPSPNIAKATALSSGTLGLTRKPAPKPPTPKGVSKPPAEDAIEMTPGTPSLQALSAPFSTRTEGERVDDLIHLESAPAKVGILAAPTFEPPSAPTNLEELSSDLIIETDDAQPTMPFGLDAPLDALTKPPAPSASENKAPAAAKAAAPAAAAAPKATEKKRSLLPFYLGGALVAVALSIGVRQLGGASAPPEPAPEIPQPQEQAPVAEPPRAEPPPSEATVAKEPESPAAPEPKPAAEPHKPTTSVVGHEPAPRPTPRAEPAEKPEATPKRPVAAEPAKPVDMGGEFDRAAAGAALGSAASSAAGCRKDGDPTGLAIVKVTFTNSGKATRAVIEGPPFAGTATGGCIAAQMRAAKVPPFGGDRVTVTKRVVIQ
jgi:hypothetical protein